MSDDTTTPQVPIEVPVAALSAETLDQLIEEFVLREGTDYGVSEVPLARKIEQVRAQLARGDVKLFFDPESESVTLRTRASIARPEPRPREAE